MISFFFFNDTATTEIYTFSLHDALPISAVETGPGSVVSGARRRGRAPGPGAVGVPSLPRPAAGVADRKSTRLNSSHANISYAVFCLKKKKKTTTSFPLRTQIVMTNLVHP